MGFRELIIETDSKSAVGLIKEGCPSSHTVAGIVAAIRDFLQHGEPHS